MATIVDTQFVTLDTVQEFAPWQRDWIYNGYDVMIPHEALESLLPNLDPETTGKFYDFYRNQSAIAFVMTNRGVKVHQQRLATAKTEWNKKAADLRKYVDDLASAVWGKGLNTNSPDEMQRFFYALPQSDTDELSVEGLGLPPVRKRGKVKGETTITCDRKALEKLENYYWARPIVNAIMALKDVEGVCRALQRAADADGRMRCTFNPGATVTGRWSSSKNPWGTGGNFQNLTEDLRDIFQPDPGYVFAYPDLEQAESRGVAYLSNDEGYINACESGDLHTAVASLLYPDLHWTSDASANRKLAEDRFYRHFSRRDLSKRGGHAANYLVTAFNLALQLGLEQPFAESFLDVYFSRFPGILRWHQDTQIQLQTKGILISPIGRRRQFFGRRTEDSTLKEAIAHIPQSLISDLVKLAAIRIFREFDRGADNAVVQLLADMHDGTLMQIREDLVPEVGQKLKDLCTIPVPMKSGKTLVIPVDLKVGYIWQKPGHKDGLDEYRLVEWTKFKKLPPLSDSLLDTIF